MSSDAGALQGEEEDTPAGGPSTRGGHRLAAVNKCSRQWALRYYWYYRPVGDKPYRLWGTLLHTCYEYFYAAMMPDPPEWFRKTALIDRLREQASVIAEPVRSQLLNMTADNFTAYRLRYADDHLLMEPVYIEEEFAATLEEIDPISEDEVRDEIGRTKAAVFRVSGLETRALEAGARVEAEYRALKSLDREIVTCRPDLIWRLKKNRTQWIRDYKSLGRSRVNYRTGALFRWTSDDGEESGEFSVNWQVLLNLKIVRARLGLGNIRGFDIQRVTRQPPYDFDRNTLTIPGDAYKHAGRVARELVAHENRVTLQIESGQKPAYRPSECQTQFGLCDYIHVCKAPSQHEMLARLNDPRRFTRNVQEALRIRERLKVVA